MGADPYERPHRSVVRTSGEMARRLRVLAERVEAGRVEVLAFTEIANVVVDEPGESIDGTKHAVWTHDSRTVLVTYREGGTPLERT